MSGQIRDTILLVGALSPISAPSPPRSVSIRGNYVASLVVGTATLVARTIEPRLIDDARLANEEVEARQNLREAPSL